MFESRGAKLYSRDPLPLDLFRKNRWGRMPDLAVDIRGIQKIYPSWGRRPPTHALKGIDLAVERGMKFCILGPNGAGKTTLISILSGLLYPDRGTGQVGGVDLLRGRRKIRGLVNFASGHANLPDNFTVDETLHYFAMLYGLPKKLRRKKAEEVTRFFEIENYRHVPFNQLSTGLKQRLALAKSLINDPEILFLDEPTVGLDPQVSNSIRSRLRELNSEKGQTIIFTTHQMDEAEELSDRIGFLKDGQFIRIGGPEELKDSIRFQKHLTVRGKNFGPLGKEIRQIPGVSVFQMEPYHFRCRIDSSENLLNRILYEAIRTGAVIENVEITKPTLGDVFIELAKGSDTG
jgi:ABC-2 type transport system ATP-binding protein